jgi:hypothetical protein
MKRFILLLFAIALGSAGTAGAADLKTSGWIGSKLVYGSNTDLGQLYPTQDMPKRKYNHLRGRLSFDFQQSQTTGAVLQTEIDYDFGDTAYGVGRNNGGGLGGDQINLETKQFYMYFQIPDTQMNVKIGLDWVGDDFDWTLLSNDVAGYKLSYTHESTTLNAGIFRFWDKGNQDITDDVDFLMLSGNQQLNATIKVGAAYYFLRDGSGKNGDGILNQGISSSNGWASFSQNAATGFKELIPAGTSYRLNSHYIGLFGETRLAAIKLEGWGLYNFGKVKFDTGSDADIRALALDARASTEFKGANISLEGIFVSGSDKDDNKKFGLLTSGSYSSASNFYYKHGMRILLPDCADYHYSSAYVYNVSNIYEDRFLGIVGLFANADLPLPGKFSGKLGLGYLRSAEERVVNGNSHMGTEVNASLSYQLSTSVGITLTSAYAWSGDFFKVSAAEAAASTKGLAANLDPANVSYTSLNFVVNF